MQLKLWFYQQRCKPKMDCGWAQSGPIRHCVKLIQAGEKPTRTPASPDRADESVIQTVVVRLLPCLKSSRFLTQRFGYGGFVQLEMREDGKANMMKDGQLFRVVEPTCWSPEVRLRDMDRTG